MKHSILFLISLLLICGCDKETSDNPITAPEGLSASSTSLKLLSDAEVNVVISGGTLPYSIVEQSNAAVASGSLNERTLVVTTTSLGSATIKVKDASTPAKMVTISIAVIQSYNAGTAGSVSFTSDRGNFSTNGVADVGNQPPTSGAGAVGLKDFDGIVLFSYVVHSTTNIDVTTMSLTSNSTMTTGTYSYPNPGSKQVQITYYKGLDPADTSSAFTAYILITSATLNLDTLTGTLMSGTFSGAGWFVDHDTMKTTQTINVTNGKFKCPVIAIGGVKQAGLKPEILGLTRRIFR
jgi:hypothetical protein